MPRQCMTSATTPAAAAPSRLPEMVAVSSRPIITCRCDSGTRSEIIAMPTGKLPPQAAPARTRSTNSSGKLVTIADRNDDTVSSSRQAIITRALPTASATGPSTGCDEAIGGEARAPACAAVVGEIEKSAAICGTTGSMARTVNAEAKIRKQTMLSVRFMAALWTTAALALQCRFAQPTYPGGLSKNQSAGMAQQLRADEPTPSTTSAPNKIVGSGPPCAKPKPYTTGPIA